MKIKLFEKKEALEVIILGINKDPYREMFHECLAVLDFDIEKETLADSDDYALIINVDGKEHSYTSYPSKEDLIELFSLSEDVFDGVGQQSGLLQAANTTRIGNCCGVGEDIYLDPNEEN